MRDLHGPALPCTRTSAGRRTGRKNSPTARVVSVPDTPRSRTLRVQRLCEVLTPSASASTSVGSVRYCSDGKSAVGPLGDQSVTRFGPIDRICEMASILRRVGPPRAGDIGLRTSVDWTEARKSAAPRSADIRKGLDYSGMQRGVCEYGIVPVERLAQQRRPRGGTANTQAPKSRPASVAAPRWAPHLSNLNSQDTSTACFAPTGQQAQVRR